MARPAADLGGTNSRISSSTPGLRLLEDGRPLSIRAGCLRGKRASSELPNVGARLFKIGWRIETRRRTSE